MVLGAVSFAERMMEQVRGRLVKDMVPSGLN